MQACQRDIGSDIPVDSSMKGRSTAVVALLYTTGRSLPASSSVPVPLAPSLPASAAGAPSSSLFERLGVSLPGPCRPTPRQTAL